ncbi:MAG: FtsX-like permease family protein [Gammaproteobacteria bacterium]|nr:FtsX-like permease family protein [Gammaproteobacteria bacterium]
MNLKLIFNFILSDWRSGELQLLLVALAIAVGTVSTITLTVDRLQKAMTKEASVFLGADRSINSRLPIPDQFVQEAIDRGITTSSMIIFNSMVLSAKDNNRSQLASVKAVEGNYPLRGKLRVADAPFGPTRETTEIPAPGEIWLNSRLLYTLDVELGDTVEVGYAPLTVTGIIEAEPDRGFSMLDISPRVLMRMADIEATQVIQPGSQLDYRLLLVNDDESVFRGLYQAIEDDLQGYRWRNVRDADERVGRALGRAESFFLIGGSMAVLLAGVAIALSANRYARRHFDHVGILKTLGARPRAILWGCLGLLLTIGLVGIVAGLIAGGAIHFGLVWYLTEQVLTTVEEVPPASLQPVLTGLATGLICLFAFALPPFLDLIGVSPLRVIRRDFKRGGVSAVVTYACAIVGSLGLLIWYSKSWEFTLWLILGIVVVTVGFGTVAIFLLRGGRIVGMQAGSLWRLAFSGLQRRNVENTGQIVVFSVVIMLLMILYLVRSSLVDEWQAQLPDDTPNHVFLNISQAQHEDVSQFIDQYTSDGDLAAFYDGRVVSVNGQPVREYQNANRPAPAPPLSSRRQLTWSVDIPDNNEVIEGEWWSESTDEKLVSVESDYARAWRLGIGDTLTFRVRGETFDVKISSIRALEWGESAQFNFFYVFSPGVFDDIPSSYRAMLYVPDEHRDELSQLIARNPTMTVIDVDSVIKQVQSVIDRVTMAVEWILILVLTSGALVLLASIQASRDSRIKEHALLRSMGGTKKLILGSLTAEFLLLGLMAGIVAIAGAELSLYLIEEKILEFDYAIRPEIWIAGFLLGGGIVASVGYLSTRKLVLLPPVTILRDAG